MLPCPDCGFDLSELPATVELPRDLAALSLEDFTKVFLPPEDLLRFLSRVTCSVRRGFRLLGVVPALRDVRSEELYHAVGPPVAARLLPNPYEVAA